MASLTITATIGGKLCAQKPQRDLLIKGSGLKDIQQTQADMFFLEFRLSLELTARRAAFKAVLCVAP